MKIFLTCLMILCTALPCFADDTIYCPKNPQERARQCKLAKEKNAKINETINNWDPMLIDSNMMMYRIVRWDGESPQQYANRVKSLKSFHYKGLDYPIRGKYTTKGVTYIPLTRYESQSVLTRAFQSERQVRQQMNYVQKNTDTLKPMIKNKITRLEKERQHHTLFLAQCCGYRWTTTEGKPLVTGKPKPTVNSGGQRGLLGVEADTQTR
ncbi:MAG: hypothetical protein R6W75_10630 [Smithellaceae bacterium]